MQSEINSYGGTSVERSRWIYVQSARHDTPGATREHDRITVIKVSNQC